MKTKIIYISGNEIFDMNDIRAAFEEVRAALNLDKSTVLFGVPVDADDACLMPESKPQVAEAETVIEDVKEEETIKEPITEEIIPTPIIDEEIIEEPEEAIIEDIVEEEPIAEEQPKKRGRPRKETVAQEESEPIVEQTESEQTDEKVVPILSILSTNDETDEPEQASEEIEIIPEVVEEKTEEEIIAEPIEEPVEDIAEESEEADLEKLLSAMTPLDISEDTEVPESIEEQIEEPEDISVDATLEQLATEFAESQDKIATENKSSRSKIGKLRNILPFKQSKHKDQGLGDLFGWAGVAANDEDFSVPGFFTNAASKK